MKGVYCITPAVTCDLRFGDFTDGPNVVAFLGQARDTEDLL